MSLGRVIRRLTTIPTREHLKIFAQRTDRIMEMSDPAGSRFKKLHGTLLNLEAYEKELHAEKQMDLVGRLSVHKQSVLSALRMESEAGVLHWKDQLQDESAESLLDEIEEAKFVQSHDSVSLEKHWRRDAARILLNKNFGAVVVSAENPHEAERILKAAKKRGLYRILIVNVNLRERPLELHSLADRVLCESEQNTSFFSRLDFQLKNIQAGFPKAYRPCIAIYPPQANLQKWAAFCAKEKYHLIAPDFVALKRLTDKEEVRELAQLKKIPVQHKELDWSKAPFLDVHVVRDTKGEILILPGLVITAMQDAKESYHVGVSQREAVKLYPAMHPEISKAAQSMLSSVKGAFGVMSVRFIVQDNTYYLESINPLLSLHSRALEKVYCDQLKLCALQFAIHNGACIKKYLQTLCAANNICYKELTLDEMAHQLTKAEDSPYVIAFPVSQQRILFGEGHTFEEAFAQIHEHENFLEQQEQSFLSRARRF